MGEVLVQPITKKSNLPSIFGEECVLGPNARHSTVTAITDCLILEVEASVMEVAQRNGAFLATLKRRQIFQNTNLCQKHKAVQSAVPSLDKVADKKPFASSIQTFFTDFFPTTPTK